MNILGEQLDRDGVLKNHRISEIDGLTVILNPAGQVWHQFHAGVPEWLAREVMRAYSAGYEAGAACQPIPTKEPTP